MAFNKKDAGDDYQIQIDGNVEGDFEKMLESSFEQKERRLKIGDKINAEVLSVGKERVIVSTGTRVDGIVDVHDLAAQLTAGTVKPGTRLDLFVTSIHGEEVFLAPGRSSSVSRTLDSNYNMGMPVKGKVVRLESFGAFVEIAPGQEAMAHVSEISWARIKHPGDLLKLGDMVSGEIVSVDTAGRRPKIAITLKQADTDPWKNLPNHVRAGQVVSAKVTRLAPFGAFVELCNGVEGLVPLSEMSREKRINRAEEVVSIGQEISVLIKDITPATRRASLSIKAATDAATGLSEAEDLRAYAARQASQNKQSSTSDFAAKIQAAMKNKDKA